MLWRRRSVAEATRRQTWNPFDLRFAVVGAAVALSLLAGCGGGDDAAPPAPRTPRLTLAITATEDMAGTFGAVGAYEKLTGTISGEVDPNDAKNGAKVELDFQSHETPSGRAPPRAPLRATSEKLPSVMVARAFGPSVPSGATWMHSVSVLNTPPARLRIVTFWQNRTLPASLSSDHITSETPSDVDGGVQLQVVGQGVQRPFGADDGVSRQRRPGDGRAAGVVGHFTLADRGEGDGVVVQRT